MKRFAATLLAVVIAGAQQPAPPQQAPAAEGGIAKFSTSLNLVVETVAVNDKSGNPKTPSPATFPLSSLIQGWQKGIPGMKPGAIRRLYIPWNMAYGERGSPPDIGPKADLIFEIKYFGNS